MCCVDAVHVRRTRDGVVLRTDGLTESETVAVERGSTPDIFEFAAKLRQQRGSELSLDAKLRVLDNLAGFDAKIDFSGGDPMVQSENRLVMQVAAQRFGKRNVTLTATGAGLARLRPTELAPFLGELNFTYDSPGIDASGLRPKRYARSNLQHAAAFQEAGVKVRAECPLTTENCDASTLTEMYHSLREAGIEKLLIMRLFPSGRGADVVLKTPTPSQYSVAVAHLRQLERRYSGPRISLQCALRGVESVRRSEANPCDLIRESFGLLADGTLLSSPWAVDGRGKPFSEDWVLGNLAQDSLSSILATDLVDRQRARLDENHGHCKIFSFLNSKGEGEDRLFDRTDPLYVPRD